MTSAELRPEDTSPAITFLVVDKYVDIRTALGDLLEDAGYAVIEAENLQHEYAPTPMPTSQCLS